MKKVLIVANLDKFANGTYPLKLGAFSRENKIPYEIFNTAFLSRASEDEKSIFLRLPKPGLWEIVLYCLEVWQILFGFKLSNTLLQMKIRAKIVNAYIRKNNFKNILLASTLDSFILKDKVPDGIYFYYPPAPWADELFYSDELSKADYKKYRDIEYDLYAKADYLSFQWHMYTTYVQKQGYAGKNVIEVNYGCNPPQKVRATYNENPRIVFLGFLAGKWVNIDLLKKLTKIYPNLDIYGGPALDRSEFPSYKGYAPTLDVLREYQFGLITISTDPLRKESFSSKHLEYLSYGLPVLTPDWRKDPLLKNTSIYYNIDNFKSVVKTYSDRKKWQEMSDRSIEFCKTHTWSETLQPLLSIFK